MSAAKQRRGLLVTGTDTGVGKTLVTAALSRILTQRNLRVGVMKPVETGVIDPTRLGPDAQLITEQSGCKAPIAQISPYRFPLAASPELAAGDAGEKIHPTEIIAVEEQLAEAHDFMLVEGAGGLMVPLRGGYLIADLARELKYPLLVVTRPNLGTINHTLLTIHAARTMDLEVAGMIVNRMPANPDRAEESAPHALASLASTDLLAVTPDIPGEPSSQVEQLASALEASPTFSWLLAALGIDA
ncbi:MAG: dethiobiotin synthase [Desulfuromonas sp.]|nr:MAG: dethiobiotin synthase [Desulfuromonas sp.]